jgi:hypothetical protein
MLLLSDEVECQIDPADLRQKIELPDGVLELYLGKTADRLSTSGFLNLTIRDRSGRCWGCSIALIKNMNVTVKNQGQLKQPNTSTVMSMRLEGFEIHAFHWDGFASRFDSRNMMLLSQSFTK